MAEKLEIKIKTCSHLKIDIDRTPKNAVSAPFIETIEEIGELFHVNEEEILCKLTKKTCVLYQYPYYETDRKINYHDAKRCPAFEQTLKNYVVEGKGKPGELDFCVSKIKEKK